MLRGSGLYPVSLILLSIISAGVNSMEKNKNYTANVLFPVPTQSLPKEFIGGPSVAIDTTKWDLLRNVDFGSLEFDIIYSMFRAVCYAFFYGWTAS